MSHVSYTELRTHLAKYMDEVCDSRAPSYSSADSMTTERAFCRVT
jgi:hypothetical protein